MNRIPYILLITILILSGCKEQASYDPESGLSQKHPIEFGVSGSLSVESKAPITSGADFIAFGDMTIGTSAAVSVFGDAGQQVEYSNGSWAYSPLRYWQVGSYFFAGVMPATHPATSAAFYTASLSTNEQGNKQITLDFGEGGYNLAEIQADLMAAFHSVNVTSLSNPASVDFDFNHQLAWVVIEGASLDSSLDSDGITIEEVKVYGNRPSTTGDIVFTYNAGTVTVDQTLADPTTAENVYKTFTPVAGAAANQDWHLSAAGSYDTIVPALLVFPEQCKFTIVVRYIEKGIEKTKVGTLSVNWEAGKKYTYKFHLATDITFSVSVSGWGDPVAVPDGDDTDEDDDIEIF